MTSKMKTPRRKLEEKPCEHKSTKVVGLRADNSIIRYCNDCRRVLAKSEGAK
jgi:hypothetical protein